MTFLNHTVILFYLIIYGQVLLELGKNKTQNYGEVFVYHLNLR